LCDFIPPTFGAGVNAPHCPITRPKRHIQPERYVQLPLNLINKHLDKISKEFIVLKTRKIKMNINDPEKVQELYIKKDTLSIRSSFQSKYSINKYGWYNWIFDQYKLAENMNILELGCGTGDFWNNKEKLLPKNINVILTDISRMMINKVKEKFNSNSTFSFQVMDIQNIPVEDKTFDIVIANHMLLYHVLDITKALSEIKRVLKNDGCFYATTIGKNNLKELQDIYRKYDKIVKFNYSDDLSFLLDNGNEILKKYFIKITQNQYIDSLEVTDANELMDYIVSYNNITKEIYQEIYVKINNEIVKNGVFKIKKRIRNIHM
jgi:ubiquinone/menaquinone biosynthesis C-methylase UbiE